jgi:hypothetical protein
MESRFTIGSNDPSIEREPTTIVLAATSFQSTTSKDGRNLAYYHAKI